jgi:hypothetical protein
MTQQDAGPKPGVPAAHAPHAWTAQHSAWLLFAPPACMVGTRWLLQLLDDRQSALPALALAPVSTAAGAGDLLWPLAVALALLAAAGLVVRRFGWRRVMPVLGAAWLILWVAGSGAMVQRHLNRQGLFLQDASASRPAMLAAPIMARVVTNQFKPPSLRSLGGAELVLQIGGLAAPHRLLIDDASVASLKPGDTLMLQLVPGRYSGLFVTGWQAPPPANPH